MKNKNMHALLLSAGGVTNLGGTGGSLTAIWMCLGWHKVPDVVVIQRRTTSASHSHVMIRRSTCISDPHSIHWLPYYFHNSHLRFTGADWWCETDNRATTSIGYCSSTTSLPVQPHCTNASYTKSKSETHSGRDQAKHLYSLGKVHGSLADLNRYITASSTLKHCCANAESSTNNASAICITHSKSLWDYCAFNLISSTTTYLWTRWD